MVALIPAIGKPLGIARGRLSGNDNSLGNEHHPETLSAAPNDAAGLLSAI